MPRGAPISHCCKPWSGADSALEFGPSGAAAGLAEFLIPTRKGVVIKEACQRGEQDIEGADGAIMEA